MKWWQTLRLLFIGLNVAILSIACQQLPASESFTIHLFAEQNPHIPDTVKWGDENSWKPLLDIDLSQSEMTLQEKDMLSYKWASQRIVYESDLREKMTQKINFSGYFVITLGNAPITSGVVLHQISAAGSRLPTIYYNDTSLQSETAELELDMWPYGFEDNSPYDMLYPKMTERVKQRMVEIDKLNEADK